MRETVSQALFAYWNELRGKRIAPRRFDIEPSCISGYLPDTFILERVSNDTTRFRLAGSRISEAFGIEFRGANLFDLFDKSDSEILRRQVSQITTQGAVGVFLISAGNGNGLATTFEVLLLPLVHTRDTVDRFLGSIVPVDKPHWLGSAKLTHRKILSHSLIWPNGQPQVAAVTAQRQTPFLPAMRHSKIVRSQRRQFQ